MLEAVGIEGELRPPRLRPDAAAGEEADRLLENAGVARDARPMMFCIGGRPSRRWAVERFGVLGKKLLHERGGTLVVVAGREDASRADEVVRAVGPGAAAVVDQSLAALAAMLGRALLVVSHDSAAAHVAAAAGAPTAVIGGATDPDIWGPYGEHARMVYDPTLECLGCKTAECAAERHLCMEAVTPEMVAEALGEITGGT
jgi:3-deoxy-D-manno-octulosonic-acid transferase